MKAILMMFAALLFFGLSVGAASSATPASLTGSMTPLQYLVGTWKCDTKVAAMNNMPASTHSGTMSFDITDGNVLSYELEESPYASAGFIGYSNQGVWWTTSADNFGGVTSESSPGGQGGVIVMNGVTMQGGKNVSSRDTITKSSDTKYEDLYETEQGSNWSMVADSVCTKTSNTPQ